MRKFALALGLALTLVVPMALPAVAAQLHGPHVGSACGTGEIGTWHFVNNQTDGAGPGFLTASWDGGSHTVVGGVPDKTNKNVQHWTVTGGTILNSASTNLPGKLVLSDWSCEDGKKS